MLKKLKGEDGSNSMDRISELPKEILQRILYFLSQEESVRTSVLSKSWRYIWCTRPNLDFSDKNFKSNKQDFLSVVNNTLQRYCDQRLCLEEFRICVFKQESVFEAESLKLSQRIAFEGLQVLHLQNVNFIKKDTFDKILSSCTLLTTMFFKECKGLKTIKLENKFHKYLKHFTFINCKTHKKDECSVEINLPTLETIHVLGSKIRFHSQELSNLKSLTTKWVEFFSDLIEQSQIRIGAPNIEYFYYLGYLIPSICFTPTPMRSNLQVCIRDVDDAQSWFLTLSKSLQAFRQSEIHLNIVQLSTNDLHVEEDILIQDIISGGNKPVVVEHFQFNIDQLFAYSSVLNGLFCICRPRKITLCSFSPGRKCSFSQGQKNKDSKKNKLIECICKIQMMRESGNQQIWKDLEDLGYVC